MSKKRSKPVNLERLLVEKYQESIASARQDIAAVFNALPQPSGTLACYADAMLQEAANINWAPDETGPHLQWTITMLRDVCGRLPTTPTRRLERIGSAIQHVMDARKARDLLKANCVGPFIFEAVDLDLSVFLNERAVQSQDLLDKRGDQLATWVREAAKRHIEQALAVDDALKFVGFPTYADQT